jgi:hypothetical protein
MVRDGSVVSGDVRMELVQVSGQWCFGPAESWSTTKRFLIGFAVLFLPLFAAIASWSLHDQVGIRNWPIAITLATALTLLCGGTPFVLILLILKHHQLRLPELRIPSEEGDLVLETSDQADFECLKLEPSRISTCRRERWTVTIPRGYIIAVQVCPWKMKIEEGETTITWASQGLLVLHPPNGDQYCRIPILLSGDFVRVAKTMRSLADVLAVPFLFGGTREQWKAEARRAKTRAPLQRRLR